MLWTGIFLAIPLMNFVLYVLHQTSALKSQGTDHRVRLITTWDELGKRISNVCIQVIGTPQ